MKTFWKIGDRYFDPEKINYFVDLGDGSVEVATNFTRPLLSGEDAKTFLRFIRFNCEVIDIATKV